MFGDDGRAIAARRWCWRQGAASGASETTTEALFVIEAHHEGADEDVARALADTQRLLSRFSPECRIDAYALSPASDR